jgi:AcrR family transcriptional regulator
MAAETTARLIEVARRAFAEQGFAATSLDALSAEAGLTRGALHHHFTNKAGLFEAVLRRVVAEIEAEIDAAWAAETDPRNALRAGFATYLDTALVPSRRRILFQDAYAVLGATAYDIMMGEGLGSLTDELGRLIAAGLLRAADPEPLAHVLNGAIMELAFWAAEDPGDEGRLARAHASMAALLASLRRD